MCEMKFLVEDDVRQLFARLCTGLAAALLAAECASWALCPALCLPLLGLFVLLAAGVLGSAAAYFARRQKRLEEAAAQVRALLDGDATARLDSGREGQLYRLFHEVNEMAAVLNAHADREQREKQFLKNTMADISHQLKTPLAALNIYNGLLQAGTDDAENVRELAELSEQELDRMEQLVQSLLKLTRLDAGTVQLEKTEQDLQGLLEQNILFPVLLDYQKPDTAYLEELLDVLDLRKRRSHLPGQLSGGQQQRVAIGRALITRPALILADEPTGNLDTRNSGEVIALLKEASRKYAQTIVMITHSRSIAQTADRVLQVSDGVLTDFGRCAE